MLCVISCSAEWFIHEWRITNSRESFIVTKTALRGDDPRQEKTPHYQGRTDGDGVSK